MTRFKYFKKVEVCVSITSCERTLQIEEREFEKQSELMNEPSQPKKKKQSHFSQGSFNQ